MINVLTTSKLFHFLSLSIINNSRPIYGLDTVLEMFVIEELGYGKTSSMVIIEVKYLFLCSNASNLLDNSQGSKGNVGQPRCLMRTDHLTRTY